jgi:nitroreductase
MDFFDVITNRESVRDYNPDKIVSKDVLLKILEAGRIAPSAANKQPWKFIMISSDDMLQKIRPCYQREWFKKAPHILVVIGEKSEAWVRQSDNYNSIETDLTIAMDHMILAAEAEGIGTCWIAAFDYEIIRDTLQLNDNQVVFTITPLGHQNEGYHKKRNKIRKSIEDIVEFV